MPESPPRLSAKESVILALLAERGEMYGLELVNASDGRLKRGTVYVTLGRMDDKGYLESRQEEPTVGAIGLPRRLYRPTAFGLRVRDAWEIAKERLAFEGSR